LVTCSIPAENSQHSLQLAGGIALWFTASESILNLVSNPIDNTDFLAYLKSRVLAFTLSAHLFFLPLLSKSRFDEENVVHKTERGESRGCYL